MRKAKKSRAARKAWKAARKAWKAETARMMAFSAKCDRELDAVRGGEPKIRDPRAEDLIAGLEAKFFPDRVKKED